MEETRKQKGTLGKVLRYIKRYWFYLALSLIFAAVTVALTSVCADSDRPCNRL